MRCLWLVPTIALFFPRSFIDFWLTLDEYFRHCLSCVDPFCWFWLVPLAVLWEGRGGLPVPLSPIFLDLPVFSWIVLMNARRVFRGFFLPFRRFPLVAIHRALFCFFFPFSSFFLWAFFRRIFASYKCFLVIWLWMLFPWPFSSVLVIIKFSSGRYFFFYSGRPFLAAVSLSKLSLFLSCPPESRSPSPIGFSGCDEHFAIKGWSSNAAVPFPY